MAGQNYSPKQKCSQVLEYVHRPWGELIYGTQQQLKALGLGIGMSFPIADKKNILCEDFRGFRTKICLSEFMGKGVYCASISFPGREKTHEYFWEPFAQGVELQRGGYLDEYKGDAISLIAAGLVDSDCFPGEPGMGKIQVTLDAEGNICRFNGRKLKDAIGRITIKKISRKSFIVSVVIPESISKIRRSEYMRKDEEWESRMRLLPRPRSLIAIPKTELTSFILSVAKRDKKFQMIIKAITEMDPNDSLKNELL